MDRRREAEPLPDEDYDAWEIPEQPRPKLKIISFGHANGPLATEENSEQLVFNVRGINNPPVKLRKSHSGLSTRLRKEVMADKAAVAKLDEIREAVEAKMAQMSSAAKSDKYSRRRALVVGIMCEEGKHRSVSFAVELSRNLEAEDWDVSVSHRDLGIDGDDDDDDENVGAEGEEFEQGRRSAAHKSKNARDQERKKGKLRGFQHRENIDDNE